MVMLCTESSVVMFTMSLQIRLILLFYVFLCVHCLFLCAAHCASSINNIIK